MCPWTHRGEEISPGCRGFSERTRRQGSWRESARRSEPAQDRDDRLLVLKYGQAGRQHGELIAGGDDDAEVARAADHGSGFARRFTPRGRLVVALLDG